MRSPFTSAKWNAHSLMHPSSSPHLSTIFSRPWHPLPRLRSSTPSPWVRTTKPVTLTKRKTSALPPPWLKLKALRSTTPLNPTEEDETPNVLRARLFERVDLAAAREVIAAYDQVWTSNRHALPADAADPELRD